MLSVSFLMCGDAAMENIIMWNDPFGIKCVAQMRCSEHTAAWPWTVDPVSGCTALQCPLRAVQETQIPQGMPGLEVHHPLCFWVVARGSAKERVHTSARVCRFLPCPCPEVPGAYKDTAPEEKAADSCSWEALPIGHDRADVFLTPQQQSSRTLTHWLQTQWWKPAVSSQQAKTGLCRGLSLMIP